MVAVFCLDSSIDPTIGESLNVVEHVGSGLGYGLISVAMNPLSLEHAGAPLAAAFSAQWLWC
ncbi:hypothetical protein GCM10028792_21900 [Salinisphaera aquimarina]